MRLYRKADIVRECDDGDFQRGLGYFRQGQVLKAQMSADGLVMQGKVRGSYAASYRQHIDISSSNRSIMISGSCSCPVGYNCKHVVAVLLTGLQEPQKSATAPAASLRPEVTNWLEALEKAANTPKMDPNAYPDDIRQRLVYVLDPSDLRNNLNATLASLQIYSVRLLKSGDYSSRASIYEPERSITYRPANYLRPVDMEILRDLHWAQRTGQYWSGHQRHDLGSITGGADLLHKIIGTGRCHYGDINGPCLNAGPELHGEFGWQAMEDGGQKLRLRLHGRQENEDEGNSFFALPLVPPHYLDLSTRQCGLLDVGLDPALAARLAAAPVLKPQEAALVRPQMERQFNPLAKDAIPLPEAPEKISTRNVTPVPILRLILSELKYNPAFFNAYRYYQASRFEKATLPLARLSFDYDGQEVAHQNEAGTIEIMEGAMLTIIPRDMATEALARQMVEELGFECIRDSGLLSKLRRHVEDFYLMPLDSDGLPPERPSAELYFHDDARFIHLSTEVIPWLAEDKGWRVEIAEDYPYRIVEDDAKWWAEIDDGSGIDWFSFAVGMDVDGEQLNLLPTLMEIIRKLPDILAGIEDTEQRDDLLEDVFNEDTVLWHRLEDGRLLPLPGPRLLPIVRILLDLAGIGHRFARLEDGEKWSGEFEQLR